MSHIRESIRHHVSPFVRSSVGRSVFTSRFRASKAERRADFSYCHCPPAVPHATNAAVHTALFNSNQSVNACSHRVDCFPIRVSPLLSELLLFFQPIALILRRKHPSIRFLCSSFQQFIQFSIYTMLIETKNEVLAMISFIILIKYLISLIKDQKCSEPERKEVKTLILGSISCL